MTKTPLARRTGATVAGLALAASTLAITGTTATADVADKGVITKRTAYSCYIAATDKRYRIITRTTVTLPDRVKRLSTVAARDIKINLVLPESLVGLLNFLGYEAVSGNSTNIKARIVASNGNAFLVPVPKAAAPKTAVPDSGTMTLKATGRLSSFKAPGAVGTAVAHLPKRFSLNAKDQDGQVLPSSPFPCKLAAGETTRLGTFRVVR